MLVKTFAPQHMLLRQWSVVVPKHVSRLVGEELTIIRQTWLYGIVCNQTALGILKMIPNIKDQSYWLTPQNASLGGRSILG